MSETALDADRLAAEAMQATGLDDFGEATWRDGLERLVVALREEARLNPLGVDIAAGELRTLLAPGRKLHLAFRPSRDRER